MPEFERDLQAIKEEVRARCDIVEIIGQYTQLKRAGKSFTGLCPFHSDKRPSFNVSPQFQHYRCWSCGEKGDVFTFIQKKENLDFLEALELLAKRVGVVFERRAITPEQASEREQMQALNRLTTAYYQSRLEKSAESQQYLFSRGILRETQLHWQLGYAPPDWEGLLYHLQEQNADLSLASRLGLIKSRQPEGSGYYDAYRNRLIFPIHDLQGSVIGYGGRALGDDPAKYINSSDSPLFNKSKVLYGLRFARGSLAATNPPVFVEGYFDVITAHQAGFTQCVATLGTAMTEEHARMLSRYSPRVIICFDSDRAGIQAALKGSALWESIGVEGAEVRVVSLPPGDDPDSMLLRGDTSAFQIALDNAVPRIDFQLNLAQKSHDLNLEEGRADALEEIIPILATIRTLAQRDRYVQKIAHLHPSYRYNISRAIDSVLTDVQNYGKQTRDGRAPRERGYPLSAAINQSPLGEQPSQAKLPLQDHWAKNTYSERINLKRDNESFGQRNSYEGNRKFINRRRETGGDSTPPSLEIPPISGVEKAERQLLRALFSAEWRTHILSRLHPDYLVTDLGRELFLAIRQSPANGEGEINPLLLLRRLEAEENSNDAIDSLNNSSVSRNSSIMSEFMHDVLEDSSGLMSNEPLSQAVINECIRRLQKSWDDRLKREMETALHRSDLTTEQSNELKQQYHEKMRETRGSHPAD